MRHRLPINPIGLFLTVCFFLLLNNISSGQNIIGVSDIDLKKTQKYYIEKGHHKFLSSGLTPGHYNSAPHVVKTEESSSENSLQFENSEDVLPFSLILSGALIPYALASYYPAKDISPAFFSSNISSLRHQHEVDLFVLFHSWKTHLS